MAKSLKNHGKDWSSQDKKDFKNFVKDGVPARVIAQKMGRTENSIRLYASNNGISFRGKKSSSAKKTSAKKTAAKKKK